MKWLFFIVTILSATCGIVDGITEDDVKNYTYPVLANQGKHKALIGNGTIIKTNEKYYFITNSEVVAGKGLDGGKHIPRSIPMTLSIVMNDKNGNSFESDPYDLYQNNRAKFTVIQSSKNNKVNLVVLPLDEIPKESKLYALDISDIADENSITENIKTLIATINDEIEGYSPKIITGTTIRPMVPDPDSLANTSIYFDSKTEPGPSGSPVFIRNKETKKWQLIGLNNAGQRDGSSAAATNTRYLKNLLRVIK